jgi:TctA family transporter
VGCSSGAAAPQATGASAGLSPAPQALPQAAGFSAGAAAPQAAVGASAVFLFHPNRLKSAISMTSKKYFSVSCFALCGSHYTDFWRLHKYALFCNLWYFSVLFIFSA